MTPRATKILEAVIREYITTGEPVSSRKLLKKYDFEVKDATIRNELNTLIGSGFLSQVHISSGRLPTDKAYRFLVQRILEDLGEVEFKVSRSLGEISEEFSRHQFDDFVNDLSEELELLSVGYELQEGEVFKSGLQELFSQLTHDAEIYDPRQTFEIVKDFELLDERMSDLLNFVKKDSQPRVFIGKSPITKSRELSVIADRYKINGDEFVLAAVGPKRMDYERNIGFFMKLKETITNNL